MATDKPRIDTEPNAERQAILTTAYEENMAKGDAPYTLVRISTYGELKWVMEQHRWLFGPALASSYEQTNLNGVVLQMVNLSGAPLHWAKLSKAYLVGVNLNNAQLDLSDLSGTYLRDSDLSGSDLHKANLSTTDLHDANLSNANLSGANLSGADMYGADLSGANLSGAKMNVDTMLDGVRFTSATRLSDLLWNGVVLLRVDWQQMRRGSRLVLGDESAISEPIVERGEQRKPNRIERLIRTQAAARAYRGLGRELKDQNLTQEASWCRLSEQRMEQRALFLQGTPRAILAGCGSAMIDLVSGYGEIPARTFISYLTVIISFAGLYGLVTHTLDTKIRPLSWDESLVLSLTSFHGRGFFPGSIPLGDWAARIGAVEALIGLFIELILIATFSRRFLGN